MHAGQNKQIKSNFISRTVAIFFFSIKKKYYFVKTNFRKFLLDAFFLKETKFLKYIETSWADIRV